MIVKICGITNLEDARLALELGANALGFNFYPPSPRFIEPSEADRIIKQLPPEALTVGIVVGPRFENIGSVQAIQVHGLKDQSEIGRVGRRVFVATTPERMHRFPDCEVVIDSSWGTGKKADWTALRGLDRQYILSGGLTPENVAEAIRTLEPLGIDVCSGVESSPGRKDPVKLQQFIRAALAAAPRGGPSEPRGIQ